MRALLSAIILLAIAAPESAAPPEPAPSVVDEAVDAALALPPGYKRDVVLRAVSRNLRWFGQPEAGLRAARAMTDGGVGEVPAGARPAPPHYVSMREGLRSRDPCDTRLWHQADGDEARSPGARETWARGCLLTRDFHWIGVPDVTLVRAAAEGLPPGKVKVGVLVMLIRTYGDADTLRFVTGEVDRLGTALPMEARQHLADMLAQPAVLYRRGLKEEAMVAGRRATTFEAKAALVRLLVAADDGADAIRMFDTMASTPPEVDDSCYGWFGPLGGLDIAGLGNAMSPSTGIGTFLDQLSSSPLFRRICAAGLEPELAVEYLLAAGRLDAAITQARRDREHPFLAVDALLQAGRARLREGDIVTARRYAVAAGTTLPAFDPGNRPIGSMPDSHTMAAVPGPATIRNPGERRGDTERRLRVIQLMAATGAAVEADALARRQPSGGLRAVALSAAAAGRAGLRFDDQAPGLSTIDSFDL